MLWWVPFPEASHLPRQLGQLLPHLLRLHQGAQALEDFQGLGEIPPRLGLLSLELVIAAHA